MVVAVPITLATRWLIPRLGGFRDAHPGQVLRLSTFDRPADATGDADVTLNDIRSGGLARPSGRRRPDRPYRRGLTIEPPGPER